jgi:hypothetical protein
MGVEPLLCRARLVALVLLLAAMATTALWATCRGDYTHVVIITLSGPLPPTLCDARQGLPPGLERFCSEAAPKPRALAALGDGRMSASALLGATPPLERTLCEQLRAKGFVCAGFVSDAALAGLGPSLGRGFARFDEPVGSGRDARRTVDTTIRYLLGDAHTRTPLFLWVELTPALPEVGRLLQALYDHGYWREALTLLIAREPVAPDAPALVWLRPPRGLGRAHAELDAVRQDALPQWIVRYFD